MYKWQILNQLSKSGVYAAQECLEVVIRSITNIHMTKTVGIKIVKTIEP